MNLGNLKIIARAMIPGAKTSVITDPVLELILNAGVVDIAASTACLKTNDTFDVEADEDEYVLSVEITDYLTMDKPGLWWNAGTGAAPDWTRVRPKTLKKLDKDSPSWRDDDSADPLHYSIDGDILTVSPPPDTDLTDGFWLYYGARPTTMTADNQYPFVGATTERPHLIVFDDALIAYARWKVNPMINKGVGQEYDITEVQYRRDLAKAASIFNRRADISAEAKWGGQRMIT